MDPQIKPFPLDTIFHVKLVKKFSEKESTLVFLNVTESKCPDKTYRYKKIMYSPLHDATKKGKDQLYIYMYEEVVQDKFTRMYRTIFLN